MPTIGCACPVCRSTDSRDRRLRPSILISYEGHQVLIDTTPDFRYQALRAAIPRIDAVLYTHGHADHILGMDDLRPLTFRLPDGLPLYADDATAKIIQRVFEYTFRKIDRYPTSARVVLHPLPETPGAEIELFGAKFIRVPVTHGRHTINGFRFGAAAYLTDMSDIPPESIPLLQDLDVLILDALRREPHPSHSHLSRSLQFVEQLKPRRAFFTHISHDLDHEATNAALPPNVRLAHDGLKLEFEIASETA